MPLSREQILQAADRKTEEVPVPEWGGSVLVKAMSGRERDAYEAGIVQMKADGSRKVTLENIRARLVSLTVVDDDGERMFKDADISALGDKSAQALGRVFDAARRLSGLAESDVEELAEGFEPAPSDGSTSA